MQNSSSRRLPVTDAQIRSDVDVVALRGDERATGHLRCWTENGRYLVEIEGPWGTVRAADDDAFSALVEVRRRLEAEGWLLAVAGARLDTYPSGMMRESGGEQVYVLVPGRPATDVVPTFAEAPPELASTVADQEAAYEAWWHSLK
jgi:hypothetical protein